MSIREQIASESAREGVLNGNAQQDCGHSDDAAVQILIEALIDEEWRLRMGRSSWSEDDRSDAAQA